jgi:hypothetical protein
MEPVWTAWSNWVCRFHFPIRRLPVPIDSTVAPPTGAPGGVRGDRQYGAVETTIVLFCKAVQRIDPPAEQVSS